MKGVDTNVLVRYLVQDDKVQTQKAIFFLEQECNQKSPAFITGIVLCELVWVLESAYEYHREQIAEVLEHILRTRQFHIHDPEILWRALRGYKETQADFSDHYIICLNHANGCHETVTFDKKAGRLPLATIL
jgi:predicted nucleic-acid-binding protein